MEKHNFTSHQIKLMKLSLAVAIIRKTPKDSSAREFTVKLSKQLDQSQANWKRKAEELSQELLRMKQENAMKNVTLPDMKNEGAAGHSNGSYASIVIDIAAESNVEAGATWKAITSHIIFIHNVTRLMRASQTVSYGILNTTYDTMHYTINEISISLSSPKPITSHKLLLLAVESIAKLLTCEEMSQYKSDLLQVTTKLLESAISRLMSSIVRHREDVITLQTIILKLSILQELFRSALVTLTIYITNAINILSTTLEDPFSLEPDMVDTLGVVFDTVDKMLTKYQHPVSQQVFASFENLVSSTALDIASVYPLVGCVVWRIYGLLQQRLA